MKIKAKAALIDGLKTGELEKVLAMAEDGVDDSVDVKSKAKAALIEGLKTGELEKVLATAEDSAMDPGAGRPEDDAEDTGVDGVANAKNKAKAALLEGFKTGELEKILDSFVEEPAATPAPPKDEKNDAELAESVVGKI